MPGSLFQDNTGAKLRDVVDGSSNTAMVVLANQAMAVEWTKPADYRPPSGAPLAGLARSGSGRQQIVQMAFADGSVHSLKATLDANTVRNIFQMNDGNPVRLD